MSVVSVWFTIKRSDLYFIHIYSFISNKGTYEKITSMKFLCINNIVLVYSGEDKFQL